MGGGLVGPGDMHSHASARRGIWSQVTVPVESALLATVVLQITVVMQLPEREMNAAQVESRVHRRGGRSETGCRHRKALRTVRGCTETHLAGSEARGGGRECAWHRLPFPGWENSSISWHRFPTNQSDVRESGGSDKLLRSHGCVLAHLKIHCSRSCCSHSPCLCPPSSPWLPAQGPRAHVGWRATLFWCDSMDWEK